MVKDDSWTLLLHNWVKEGDIYRTKKACGDRGVNNKSHILNVLIFRCLSGI